MKFVKREAELKWDLRNNSMLSRSTGTRPAKELTKHTSSGGALQILLLLAEHTLRSRFPISYPCNIHFPWLKRGAPQPAFVFSGKWIGEWWNSTHPLSLQKLLTTQICMALLLIALALQVWIYYRVQLVCKMLQPEVGQETFSPRGAARTSEKLLKRICMLSQLPHSGAAAYLAAFHPPGRQNKKINACTLLF